MMFAAMLMIPGSVSVAAVPQTSSTSSSPRAVAGQEVLVEGERGKIPKEVNPDTVFKQAGQSVLAQRKIYENSQRIATCAMRLPVDRLRAAIDGAPNSRDQRAAMSWIIQKTAYCNANPNIVRYIRATGAGGAAMTNVVTGDDTSPFVGDNNPQTERSMGGTSVYDRGALLEEVLAAYAPDFELTRQQTGDRAVQLRFDALEVPRNGQRDDDDFRYFGTVVCMVRMEPRLATRMLRAKPGSTEQVRAQAAMINRARVCVGNARQVKVDPTQFRLYVADAVFRWTLAARGVPSLFPPTA